MINDLMIIIHSYLILFLFHIAFYPLIWTFFYPLFDRGWGVCRVLGLVIIGLFLWILGHANIPVNSYGLVFFVVLIIASIIYFLFFKNLPDICLWIKNNLTLIIVSEIIFGLGFISYSIVRGFQPDIYGLEKFMDFGLVQSYLQNKTLPALDMWFAGELINYYSFGHFLITILIRLWWVLPEIGYNLALGWIFASSLLVCFSFSINLSKLLLGSLIKFPSMILSGICSAILVNVAGNSHILYFFISNFSLRSYWYPSATRYIPNTIHEFPCYSYVVSDLHAHLIDLPITLTFLVCILLWVLNKTKEIKDFKDNYYYDILLGMLLGVMIMTNTWDFLIYALFTTILGLFLLYYRYGTFVNLFVSALIVILTSFLTSFLWAVNFQSISHGICYVREGSKLKDLVALWMIHVSFVYFTLYSTYKIIKKLDKKFLPIIFSLIITAFILLILPEFIYVKDIYPVHPRANTMFKLTYHAFIMLSLLGGYSAGVLYSIKKQNLLNYVNFLLLSLTILFLLIYTRFAFSAYYLNFREYKGLDGLAWFKQERPDEYEIVNFLKNYGNGKNLVEAPGKSYSFYNAISAFSGLPTIIGWEVHEWLWRGNVDLISKRQAEVTQIYESKDIQQIKSLLNKYNIGWIIIGKNEWQKYNIDEEFLKGLGLNYIFGRTILVKYVS